MPQVLCHWRSYPNIFFMVPPVWTVLLPPFISHQLQLLPQKQNGFFTWKVEGGVSTVKIAWLAPPPPCWVRPPNYSRCNLLLRTAVVAPWEIRRYWIQLFRRLTKLCSGTVTVGVLQETAKIRYQSLIMQRMLPTICITVVKKTWMQCYCRNWQR